MSSNFEQERQVTDTDSSKKLGRNRNKQEYQYKSILRTINIHVVTTAAKAEPKT